MVVLALLCATSLFAQTPVPLKGGRDGKGGGGNPGNNPIPHAPAQLLTLNGVLDDGLLTLYASVLEENIIEITIYDEFDNVVLSEQYVGGNDIVIDISFLPIGFYSILLETDIYTFEGEFEIE